MDPEFAGHVYTIKLSLAYTDRTAEFNLHNG